MDAGLRSPHHLLPGYALLDSGNGRKLERFGEITLIRPSSLAVWRPRLDSRHWQSDAEYLPDQGWHQTAHSSAEWQMSSGDLQFALRLQRNGQVGLFPEHAAYLPAVTSRLTPNSRVLNLFGYTGLATLACVQAGAHVTHVDLSKSALTWAAQNIDINEFPREQVRFIAEDALRFLQREIDRENRYDVVIADPPSFSRPTRATSWNLEEVVTTLVTRCVQVGRESNTLVVLTSHHQGASPEVFANLVIDAARSRVKDVQLSALAIGEQDSRRMLPAGGVCMVEL